MGAHPALKSCWDDLWLSQSGSGSTARRFPDHFPTNLSGRGKKARHGTAWRGRSLDTKSALTARETTRRYEWTRIKSPEL